VRFNHRALVFLLAACLLRAGEPTAAELNERARKAERAGDVVTAYVLYAQAAAVDSKNPKYWGRSQALERRAALKAHPLPAADADAAPAPNAEETEEADQKLPEGFSKSIDASDLSDVERMRPPPELKPLPGKKSFDLRGPARSVIEQVARAFGLDTIFDGDYGTGPTVRLRVEDADYRQALHAAEAATGSFVFPLGERLMMAVKDTPQKRAQNEPAVAVTIPIPQTVTAQEAQELGRAVQQAMDLTKLAVDQDRRLILIKDRISKVRPAQLLFEQLALGRGELMVELDFLEVDRTNSSSYGVLLPSQFSLTWLGGGGLSSVVSLARVFAGHTVIGFGIANAQLFATMSASNTRTLLRAQTRAADGQPATFHVGDKYPVLTGTLLGGGASTYPSVSSFNFEDLGLALKVTPHMHGEGEVTLDVEAEFKVLSGSTLNGIPLISNRKLQSRVRLANGELGVIAGLMSSNEAHTITGVAGLSQIPVLGKALREHDHTRQDTDVLLLIKPSLLRPPPGETVTRFVWLGSETRLDIPL